MMFVNIKGEVEEGVVAQYQRCQPEEVVEEEEILLLTLVEEEEEEAQLLTVVVVVVEQEVVEDQLLLQEEVVEAGTCHLKARLVVGEVEGDMWVKLRMVEKGGQCP